MRRKKGELSFYSREKKFRFDNIKEWLYVAFYCCIAVLVAFVLVYLLGNRFTVIGSSMLPTYCNGQMLLVNKISYILFSPDRGDVIAFYPNGNKDVHCYIKRVVGLPGETITITNGNVYINGEIVEGKYDYSNIEEGGIATSDYVLGDHEYFVIGDNFNNSEDSRSGNVGTVMKEYIFGKVWFHFGKNEYKWGFD